MVIPTLLTWPGSAIIHDIKGENWQITAGFRNRFRPGFAVHWGTKFAVRAISEGLCQEAGPTIRSTIISPGTVTTELPSHISGGPLKDAVNAMYAAAALSAGAVANAIQYAVSQTPDVDVNEIVIQPTAQEF